MNVKPYGTSVVKLFMQQQSWITKVNAKIIKDLHLDTWIFGNHWKAYIP